mmetsp:Transcript_6716/g.11324  ORF Transcript_6716/g.11324 Transcript_6716/m.11324 type:complete len:300 (-) Transcript_6716:1486-2385(-)
MTTKARRNVNRGCERGRIGVMVRTRMTSRMTKMITIVITTNADAAESGKGGDATATAGTTDGSEKRKAGVTTKGAARMNECSGASASSASASASNGNASGSASGSANNAIASVNVSDEIENDGARRLDVGALAALAGEDGQCDAVIVIFRTSTAAAALALLFGSSTRTNAREDNATRRRINLVRVRGVAATRTGIRIRIGTWTKTRTRTRTRKRKRKRTRRARARRTARRRKPMAARNRANASPCGTCRVKSSRQDLTSRCHSWLLQCSRRHGRAVGFTLVTFLLKPPPRSSSASSMTR